MDWEQCVAEFQPLDFHPSQFPLLADCFERHKTCQRVVVDHEDNLPKRLLYLGEPAGQAFPARLVLTEDIEHKPVRYVALTHCWSHLSEAEKLAIKTTPDNQKLRAQQVDVGTFPRNYQAVMVMCRSFGFNYFWMDSICILQDDDKEWKEESVRMRHVYGAATLTIALNTSQDLFTMDRSKKSRPEWEVTREQWCAERFEKNVMSIKRILEGGILGTRAWCFQERHLSPRLLHILDNGVVICECAKAWVFTNTPSVLGFREKKPGGLKLAGNQRLVEIINGAENGLKVHMPYWHNYLLEYQRRALFDNTDNLTALAGIAEAMQVQKGWTYLSGIWKEDLPRGMLWESTSPNPVPPDSHKRFSHYHAPTWSWSSVDGSTRTVPELVDKNGYHVCEVYERDKESPRSNPRVRTSLVSDISITAPSTEPSVSPLQEGSALELKGLLIPGRCRGNVVQRGFTTSKEMRWHDYEARMEGDITFDVDPEADDGDLWCLLLVKISHASRNIGFSRSEDPPAPTYLGVGLRKANSRAWPGRSRIGGLGDGEEEEKEEEEVTDRFRRLNLVRTARLEDGNEQAIDTFRRVGLMRLAIRDGTWRDLSSRSQLLRII